ncbi:MAG: hypothetical protein JRH20_20465 [Deltaproteobacteria bacterium]|nr:hypothetical protein [Deltaproteobacteria bacterium]
MNRADIFLASFTENGVHLWSKGFGGLNDDEVEDLAVDSSGNITIVGGYVSSVTNLGGGDLKNAGYSDIFIASYDSTGAHRWSKGFGSAGDDVFLGIGVDGNGNVITTGLFSESIDVGGGLLTSEGLGDMVIASYDSTGTYRWSKGFGATMQCAGNGVAVDSAGNVVIVGSLSGTEDFGGGPLTGMGIADGVAISYDSGGTYRWSKLLGGSGRDEANDAVVDGMGNVIITGTFTDSADFGGGPLTSAGGEDIFLVKFSPSL